MYKIFELELKAHVLQHKNKTSVTLSFPTVVLNHMNHLDNKLAFLVFLTIFKRMFL